MESSSHLERTLQEAEARYLDQRNELYMLELWIRKVEEIINAGGFFGGEGDCKKELADLALERDQCKQTMHKLAVWIKILSDLLRENSPSSETKMMVYDAIINETPIQDIPSLLETAVDCFGVPVADIPTLASVQAMAEEVKTVSDLLTLEEMTAGLTLGMTQ